MIIFIIGLLVGLFLYAFIFSKIPNFEKEIFEPKDDLGNIKRENKDPKDNRWTIENSTKWECIDTVCSSCLSRIGHEEYMASFCEYCGRTIQPFRHMRQRKIWYNGQWLKQIQHNSTNYVISKMKLTPHETVRDDHILLWEEYKYCGNKRVDKLTGAN